MLFLSPKLGLYVEHQVQSYTDLICACRVNPFFCTNNKIVCVACQQFFYFRPVSQTYYKLLFYLFACFLPVCMFSTCLSAIWSVYCLCIFFCQLVSVLLCVYLSASWSVYCMCIFVCQLVSVLFVYICLPVGQCTVCVYLFTFLFCLLEFLLIRCLSFHICIVC